MNYFNRQLELVLLEDDEFSDLLGDEPLQDIDDDFSILQCQHCGSNIDRREQQFCEYCGGEYCDNCESAMIRGIECPWCSEEAGQSWPKSVNESEEFDDLLGDDPVDNIEDMWDMEDTIHNLTGRDHQIEQQILRNKNPEWVNCYAKYIIMGRWPEAEPIIMKDSRSIYYYVIDVIHGRWPEAEPIIMKDPQWSRYYAQYCGITESEEFDDLLGDEPLYDAEDQWNIIDIIDRLTGRDPQVEQTILRSKNPQWAHSYAHEVIKGRWPEAEHIIMKNPAWAFYYTHEVIRGRWPEAEPFIMRDPKWACYYACNVINRRWQEAEPFIMRDPKWSNVYKNEFGITESEEFDDLLGDDPVQYGDDEWGSPEHDLNQFVHWLNTNALPDVSSGKLKYVRLHDKETDVQSVHDITDEVRGHEYFRSDNFRYSDKRETIYNPNTLVVRIYTDIMATEPDQAGLANYNGIAVYSDDEGAWLSEWIWA